MAEEPEVEGYFLDFVIEPLADMLVSLMAWEEEIALSYAKWVVYGILSLIVVVIILYVIRFVRG